MRIIDAHVHLLDEPGYLDKLLAAMDDCEIEKCCLSGLGPLFAQVGNEEVKKAFQTHSNRIIAAVYIRPGVDGPEAIDRAYEDGFRMVKVTLPLKPYNYPEYWALWERALEHKMPVLFHTGIVAPSAQGRGKGVSSWNMQPMQIEPISREFPDLGIIMAHLGVSSNMDAAEIARMRPNVYVDLTGEPEGWRVRADHEGMDKYLWWPGAFDKVAFGTDVHCSKMKQILKEDIARLDRLGIGEETRRKTFSENILRLLGLEA